MEVIADADVAAIYGVDTKYVNRAVRNNPDKFPPLYVFELTANELRDLRCKNSSTKVSLMNRNPTKVFSDFPDLSRAVGVDNAGEMVHFVLEDAGHIAGDGVAADVESLRVDVADCREFGPGYVAAEAGNRQAALTADDGVAPKRVDLHVGVGDEGLSGQIQAAYHYQPAV